MPWPHPQVTNDTQQMCMHSIGPTYSPKFSYRYANCSVMELGRSTARTSASDCAVWAGAKGLCTLVDP